MVDPLYEYFMNKNKYFLNYALLQYLYNKRLLNINIQRLYVNKSGLKIPKF